MYLLYNFLQRGWGSTAYPEIFTFLPPTYEYSRSRINKVFK